MRRWLPAATVDASTVSGDITLTVAVGSGANVAVSTFNGEFESEFPVPLESFQGTIQLVRPGGAKDRERRQRPHSHGDDQAIGRPGFRNLRERPPRGRLSPLVNGN